MKSKQIKATITIKSYIFKFVLKGVTAEQPEMKHIMLVEKGDPTYPVYLVLPMLCAPALVKQLRRAELILAKC